MADYFIVEGGHKLKGELTPQGAKNEALQIICATLMTTDPVRIINLPEIVDVLKLINLVKGLGVKVTRHSKGNYTFEAAEIDLQYMATEDYQREAGKIRGSIMLISVMLARFGRAFLPKPGGDKIGRRRLDTHFNGLKKLGAEFNFDTQAQTFSLRADKLKGDFVLMEEISVTGTANMVLAASLAKGTTTIYNAACEPYLQQLCTMLTKMGAKIDGIGSNMLSIKGVGKLNGCEHQIQPDMIEIGSFIGMAALTGSHITIKNLDNANLGIIPDTFRKLGIEINDHGDHLDIPAQDHYEIASFIDGSILTVYDSPWPGFTPDLISILLVTATQAKGSILIHQKMFESRLFFVDKLIDMGAQIILCDPHRATVIGIDHTYSLRGIKMSSPDIRAGVSLLLAALSAEGESVIYNINQIDRGYENIDTRLNAIGANIVRKEQN